MERFPLAQRALDERLALLETQHDLTAQDVDRFVLLFVILEAEDVPGLDVQDLADVAIGPRPDDLVAPGLVNAIGKVGHNTPGIRNVECGMWNCRARSLTAAPAPASSGSLHMPSRTRRTPHIPPDGAPGGHPRPSPAPAPRPGTPGRKRHSRHPGT